MKFNQKQIKSIINDICETGGQNAEMIAEDIEIKTFIYDENVANSILDVFKRVLYKNLDEVQDELKALDLTDDSV